MKKLKIAVCAVLLTFLVGCETLNGFVGSAGKVVLDRAKTLSSALALRDGYLDLRVQIIANADSFTSDEQSELQIERENVEAFYQNFIELTRGGTASEVVVNVDEFLDSVLTVRESVNSALIIIEPKLGQLNPEGTLAAANFIANYRSLSLHLDQLLVKNNRAEAVQMAARLLRAATPVITSLLAK